MMKNLQFVTTHYTEFTQLLNIKLFIFNIVVNALAQPHDPTVGGTQYRAAGVTAADYPLNTDRMAIRSLLAYLAAEMLTRIIES
jgi:hypothetical protein